MVGDKTQAIRQEHENRRDELFAQIAVEQGALAPEQAEEVRRAQEALRKQGARTSLSDLCVERGLMDAARVLLIRQEMRKRGWRPLVGKYELQRKIGEGGMGTVYLARNVSIGKTVALKLLPSRLARDAGFARRFEREARLAARISHPNVVQVLDADEAVGRRFLVMEYVEGESLRERLRRSGPLAEAEAAALLRQVASGLAVAHAAGIVHRDIKPANILLDTHGVPKVADLGVARSLDDGDTTVTRDGSPLGTPLYMAPEQSGGASAADARSDIYSLGATFYHALAGAPPFEGETLYEILRKHIEQAPRPLRDIRPDLSPGLAAIVEKMMSLSPEGRYPSCEALIEDLDNLLAGAAPSAVAEHRAKRRLRWAAALAAGVGLALLLAGIAAGTGLFPERGGPPPLVQETAPEDLPGEEDTAPPRAGRRGEGPEHRPSALDEWSPTVTQLALEETLRNPLLAPGGGSEEYAPALRRLLDAPESEEARRETAEALEALAQEGQPHFRAAALNALAALQHQAGREEEAQATRNEAMLTAVEGLVRHPAVEWSGEDASARQAAEALLREPDSRQAALAAAEELDLMAERLAPGAGARPHVLYAAAAARYLAGDAGPWARLVQRGRREADRPPGRGRQDRERRAPP